MIQRNLFFCLLAITVICIAEHASGQTTIGAKSVAIGQTGTAVPGNQWAIFSNSALITTDHRQVSFYGFRYVGITEISDLAASVSYPTAAGTFGVGFHRYGFDLFSETHLRVAYKRQLKHVHAGLAVNYAHIQQGGGYGSAGAVGVHIGIAARIIESFWMGARATNVNQPYYVSTEEYLPRELAVGISYFPSAHIMLTADAVKDTRFPISVRAGTEVMLIRGLHARTGITTKPETYAGGFGYKTTQWQINFGVQQHIPLGLSPAIDLGVTF